MHYFFIAAVLVASGCAQDLPRQEPGFVAAMTGHTIMTVAVRTAMNYEARTNPQTPAQFAAARQARYDASLPGAR